MAEVAAVAVLVGKPGTSGTAPSPVKAPSPEPCNATPPVGAAQPLPLQVTPMLKETGAPWTTFVPCPLTRLKDVADPEPAVAELHCVTKAFASKEPSPVARS